MTTIEKVKELVSNGGSYVGVTNGSVTCKGWIPYVKTKTRFEVLNVKTEKGVGSILFNTKGKMIKNNIHSNNDTWSLVLEAEKKIENIISESEMYEYINVQSSGWYNMFDARARELTSLSRVKWITIMQNFDYLYNHYKKKGVENGIVK